MKKCINVDLIKELRKKSQAGLSDCQYALSLNDENIDAAFDWLKDNGKLFHPSLDLLYGTHGKIWIFEVPNISVNLIQVSCQFQHTLKDPEFIEFVENIGSIWNDQEQYLKKLNHIRLALQDWITISKIETILIEDGTRIFKYIHNSRIGVLVKFKSADPVNYPLNGLSEATMEIIAQQILGTNPISITPKSMSLDIYKNKVSFFHKKVDSYSGLEKLPGEGFSQKAYLINCFMEHWFSEVCLMEQKCLQNESLTIKEILKNKHDETGYQITEIKRLEISNEIKLNNHTCGNC